jgi:magnesium transporter
MSRAHGRRVGARPGTLHIDPASPQPVLHVTVYGESSVEEIERATAEQIRRLRTKANGKIWVDVQGFGDETVLRELAELFAIHPLALEDLVHEDVRPKAEPYENNLLVISRLPYGPDADSIRQLGLVVGRDYVLTFRPLPGAELDPVRRRLEIQGSRLRMLGSDYLTYALLDTAVDAYPPLIQGLVERTDELEDRVIADTQPETLRELNEIRGELLALRRTVTPQREAVRALVRGENEFIGRPVQMYLRDTQDHIEQVAEAVDSTRELAAGLMGTYVSVVSQKTNDVMKILTIVASVFVPLTFLAGVYGMNFEYMPELGYRWGYPVLLVVMALVTGGMLLYFRRKGWLGR